MLLAALLALAPLQASDAETYCIEEKLTPTQRIALGSFLIEGLEALPRLRGATTGALEACVAQWKWDERRQNLAILVAAGETAVTVALIRAQGRLDEKRLEALLHKVPRETLLGFTLSTAENAPEEARAAETAADALLAAEKIAPVDRPLAIAYFKAMVRAAEAAELWDQMSTPAPR